MRYGDYMNFGLAVSFALEEPSTLVSTKQII
jgi:hypothetical protein